MFGKTIDELQDITIVDGVAYGTLKYVDDYSSAFGGDLSSGHYLALKTTAVDGATLSYTILGGSGNVVELDNSGVTISRITSTNQSIQFIATKNGTTETYNISLAGIILE